MTAASFRVLVVASIALELLGAVIDLLLPSLIPQSITSAVDGLPLSSAFENYWFIGFVLVYALAMLVASVGLIFFRRWARAICFWGSLAGFALYPLVGPMVYSGLSLAMQDLSSIMWGAVLAIAFFSPLRKQFSPGRRRVA